MKEGAASAPPTPPAAIVTGWWTTVDKMSLRRGFLRLGISLVVLWLVFWTFAYVLNPSSSIKPGPATFAIRVMAWSVSGPCLIVAVILGVWTAVGFRSK
jgi:hypothetical protein